MPTNHIQGLDQLLRQLSGLETKITQVVEAQTQLAAESIAETAKQLAPVASGRLRDSIQVLKDAGGWYRIGTSVEYAAAKELGVRNSLAKPFLFPAYLRHKDELLDNLKKALRNA